MSYNYHIKPRTDLFSLDLKELYDFRELFFIFAWRDIKVRYKQTVIGILWVVFQPLVTMLIFTIFFGRLARIPSGSLPYSLFVLTGLVFWNFFANSLTHASLSLVENENIIKKVYFPKIILPLAAVVTTSVDLAINLAILFLYALYLGFTPSWQVLLIIPIGLIVIATAASGLGLLLASVNVKYRDVRYILPFFIQIMLFLSPVIYGSDLIDPSQRIFMAINPTSGVIESVRRLFTQSNFTFSPDFAVSALVAVVIFLIGLAYFRHTERFFADIV